MFSRIGLTAVHLGLPEEFSTLLIQTQHGLRLLQPIRRGEIDAITNYCRRAVPATRHGRFPENAFRLAPLHGRVLSRRRHAIAGRPSPRGPVQRRVNSSNSSTRRKDESYDGNFPA